MEEETVNPDDYTVAGLRSWLQQLGMPSDGNKATLVVRLNNVPIEERGERPNNIPAEGKERQREEQQREDETEQQSTSGAAAVDVNTWTNKTVDRNANDKNMDRQQIEWMTREIELLRRKKEFMKKENEFLRRIAKPNDRGETDEKQTDGVAATGEFTLTQQFGLWKEMLPEFDGVSNIDVWLAQLRNLEEVYSVGKNNLHTLFVAKLKGKAQEWLHAQPNFLKDDVGVLVDGLKEVFGTKQNKMETRKKFESRKWKTNESFAEYFHDKVRLAAGLEMDEEEFTEYAIEGFTDDNMKLYAHVQGFTTKAGLLRAFTKVVQRKEQTGSIVSTSSSRETGSTTDSTTRGRQTDSTTRGRQTGGRAVAVRCYNCNSLGHVASVCSKPKREYGACYACGAMGHVVATCPERKSAVHQLSEDDKSEDYAINCVLQLLCGFPYAHSTAVRERKRREMLKLCKINACPNGTLGLHLSRAPWDPYPWVSEVQDGSNAYHAGVRSGDSVLELNGSDVLGQKISEMAKKIQSHWVGGGSFVTILIWRNKTENNPVNQQSLQKFAKCLQQIAQLLECPICLEIVKPPGWQCCNGHVLCNSCRGRTVKCPICRVTLGPRGRCLLSDKLFTLLAESFPCDGVKNGNSPPDYNDCQEKPLISVKIDRPPSSELSSAILDKVHHRKQIAGHTVLGHLKKSDDDNSQLAADDDNSTSPDDNIVVLKRNLKSQKKSDFMEHGSCHHRHHHHQQHQHQQQQLYHHHRSHSHHGRQLLGQQQHQRTFHCPTGKSSCLLLHNATDGISSSNNFGPDPDTKTLNRIWTQEVPFRKSKGDQQIETLAKLITEWDVLSHLTQVHQISVAQHYTTFGQPVRLQFAVNTKSMPCITIQSQRTCIQNKENFKNNINVSVGGVFLPSEGIEKNQGHTLDRRHKNARMTSVPKDVHRPATELFFVACMPLDSDEDMEVCVHQEGLRNEMNVVCADTRGDLPPPPSCLTHEFDDAAVDLPVFVGLPNGPSAGAGVIKTPTKSKSTRESTYNQTTGHLIQDPGSELPSTTCQSRVNVERSPISSRCVCTNSSKVDACTWCTSSSSSSSSTSSSCSSSLASFSMCSSSYRCCSNTTTLQHAIFIWYFGSESDVKNFQTVIECKRTGLKWTGCVHPLTKSWSSIRSVAHMQQFLVLNSMPDGGDNFFDIVIKIK